MFLTVFGIGDCVAWMIFENIESDLERFLDPSGRPLLDLVLGISRVPIDASVNEVEDTVDVSVVCGTDTDMSGRRGKVVIGDDDDVIGMRCYCYCCASDVSRKAIKNLKPCLDYFLKLKKDS